MPLQRLDVAAGVRPSSGLAATEESTASRGKVLRTYKWFQHAGQDNVTEFDEAHFALEGQFEQNSSQGHKDYQDRLRAAHLRKEGMDKSAIAKSLGRSEQFVAKWWKKEKDEIPAPYGVHAYLTKDMGRRANGVGATSNATELDSSAMDAATHWRDVELRRKFATEPEIYDEIVEKTDWKGSPARTRDFATGGYHAKYDRYGRMRMFGHQGGKYEQGLSPALDKGMQRLFAEYGIADRTSGVITNWYPDGDSYLGSHRHDCWTALFSFGHERILTLDKTPILMQHGDMVIFGTQRHGVPFMPEVTEGRITVVVFFYPDAMQKKMMWQTITDPETMAPSRPLVSMLRDRHLGGYAEQQAVEARPSGELQQVVELGFNPHDAQQALHDSKFDVQQAVELLLLAGKGGNNISGSESSVSTRIIREVGGPKGAVRSSWRGRFRNAHTEIREDGETSASFSEGSTVFVAHSADGAASSAASNCTLSMASDDRYCSEDESFARRLYLEDADNVTGVAPAVPCDGSMTDAEIAALAVHFEEQDRAEGVGNIDPELLAVQFEEYDSKFKLDDAEFWNGTGDLMLSGRARANLTLETMDKVTIYSVGHGDMLEKDFYEMLQCHSIRVLYDIRPTDHRGEHRALHQRFSVASLRSACRSRGIIFKPMPIGKESAYGALTHIKSDEGKHTLLELVWQAKRKHTAFLGSDGAWRNDARQVTADVLARAGHVVEHVNSDGSSEQHKLISDFPDWLLQEEERLRKIEKKRQAGEMAAPQTSRTDRSSEVVASRLSRPAEQIDAMQELKGAANQNELIVAQRKLARQQRVAEEKGALAAKVLKGAPEWVLEDARKQAEWVAEKKKQKELRDSGASTVDDTSKFAHSSDSHGNTSSVGVMESHASSSTAMDPAAQTVEELQVQCAACGVVKSWTELAPGDGYCAACLVGTAVEELDSATCTELRTAPCDSIAEVSHMAHASNSASPQQCDPIAEVSQMSHESNPAAPQRSSWRSRRANRSQISAPEIEGVKDIVGAH